MLTGRWLLFFGLIWALMNLLVSSFSASGAGSDTAHLVGYLAEAEGGVLGGVGNVDEAIKLSGPMSSVEAVEQSGWSFEKAKSFLFGVGSWATLSYPGVIEGPVWGFVRGIWAVFGGLLLIMAFYTIKQFLTIA